MKCVLLLLKKIGLKDKYMVIRFIISFLFLAVTSFGITAKSITLNKLDISKIPPLEEVLKTVSEEGDSVASWNKKIFLVYLQEYQGGLYCDIELIEGPDLPPDNYIGYLCIDKNLFFICNRTKIEGKNLPMDNYSIFFIYR